MDDGGVRGDYGVVSTVSEGHPFRPGNYRRMDTRTGPRCHHRSVQTRCSDYPGQLDSVPPCPVSLRLRPRRRPQITIDRWLGGGKLWTERLQGWLVSPKAGLGRLTVAESERILKTDKSTIRWYDIVVSAVYQSHFLVPYVTAGILWRHRTRWRWYAATFVAVNFVSCAIFALYATAPPWYAAQNGLIDPFPRVLASRAWSRVGLSFASRVIEKGQGTVNPFAAIPSLHSAQALMVAIFLWGVVWKPLRPLLALFPLTMAFALVYSGEHYLIDVFAGWAMVALALTVGWKLRQRKGWASPFSWPTLRPPDPAPVDAGNGSTAPVRQGELNS